MKKLKCFIVFCLLFCLNLSLLSSCGNGRGNIAQVWFQIPDEIEELSVLGRSKKVTDPEDIERIMDFIDGLEKEETEKNCFNLRDRVSIEIYYRFSNETERFWFCKGCYCNNGIYYKLSDDDYSKLMSLYDELDCEEYYWSAIE